MEKRKCLFSQIKEGEWANCIVYNIDAKDIHTINSPYIEEILDNDWVSG